MKDYNYATLAEYYDILEDNESISKFNKVLDKILKKNKVKSVLDMTCGTGVQSIFLDKKKYQVTPSDYSSEMLNVARKKYSKLKWAKGDIRTSKYGKFDAVISIFNAIGHLTKKDFEKAILNVRENLNHNGIYVFDIFNLDFMRNGGFIDYEFIDKVKEIKDTKLVRFSDNKIDSDNGIMHIHNKTFIQNSIEKPKIFDEKFDLQIYSSSQLKEILENNGFKVVKFLSIGGSKFNKKNSLFVLTIARKK